MISWDDFNADEKPNAPAPIPSKELRRQLRTQQVRRQRQWFLLRHLQPDLPLVDLRHLLPSSQRPSLASAMTPETP